MLVQVFSFLICVFCVRLMLGRCKQLALPAQIGPHAILSIGFGAAALSAFSPPAFAAEWFMTPGLRLGYEQNDNIRMTLQPHETVHGSIISPKLDLGVESEIWGVTGTAQIVRRRYSGDEFLDKDDEKFRFASHYRTERSNFALSASRVNDAVISTEELDDPDLGLVTAQKSRRTENIQPVWKWSITERASMQLGYTLSDVSYTDGESVGIFDYQWHTATATWSYLLSPRSQFFFTTGYSRYRAPETDIQSQTIIEFMGLSFLGDSTITDIDSRTPSYKAGMSYNFSETMEGTFMLGRRKTESERAVTDCITSTTICSSYLQTTRNSGTTFSGNLTKNFEKLSIKANASRELTASGAGTEYETDLLSVQFEYPFTARLRGELTSIGRKLRGISDVTSSDRKHYSVQPSLHWRWTRDANLSLAYRYSHLDREVEDQAVQSRALYISLGYVWPKLSVSR